MSDHQLGPITRVARPPLGDISRLATTVPPFSALVWVLTDGWAEAAGSWKAPTNEPTDWRQMGANAGHATR